MQSWSTKNVHSSFLIILFNNKPCPDTDKRIENELSNLMLSLESNAVILHIILHTFQLFIYIYIDITYI